MVGDKVLWQPEFVQPPPPLEEIAPWQPTIIVVAKTNKIKPTYLMVQIHLFLSMRDSLNNTIYK